MTQPTQSQEPSMGEILASIRRIIADDDAGKPAQRSAQAAKPSQVASPLPGPLSAVSPAASPEPDAAEMDTAASPVESTFAINAKVEDQSGVTFDLTTPMTAAVPASPALVSTPGAMIDAALQFRKANDRPEVSFDQPMETRTEQRAIEALRRQDNERGQLVSRETSAAVDSAFNVLTHAVLAQNARTLEDLVREMLRPMLKTWLDDNLPGLVERLVRSEIERVSRGR